MEAGKLELHVSDVVLVLLPKTLRRHGEGERSSTESRSAARSRCIGAVGADERMLSGKCLCSDNLLSNAVKFTPDGGQVCVRAAERAPGGAGRSLELSVSDTGVGIEADNLERVFQPFEQVVASPKMQAEGTGLGLALLPAPGGAARRPNLVGKPGTRQGEAHSAWCCPWNERRPHWISCTERNLRYDVMSDEREDGYGHRRQ